jgi:hypothetical protein
MPQVSSSMQRPTQVLLAILAIGVWGDVTNLTFDCTYQVTDCVRIWKQESIDGTRLRESLDNFDRRPYTGRVESSQGVQRITLADENQNAQLEISDPPGRPRIPIGVNRANERESRGGNLYLTSANTNGTE